MYYITLRILNKISAAQPIKNPVLKWAINLYLNMLKLIVIFRLKTQINRSMKSYQQVKNSFEDLVVFGQRHSEEVTSDIIGELQSIISCIQDYSMTASRLLEVLGKSIDTELFQYHCAAYLNAENDLRTLMQQVENNIEARQKQRVPNA